MKNMVLCTVVIKYSIIESENEFCIFSTNIDGGAIIADENLEVALNMFKEAMHLSIAIKNLLSIKNGDNEWVKIIDFEQVHE